MNPSFPDNGDIHFGRQPFYQFIVRAICFRGMGSIAAHGSADHIDSQSPGIDAFLISGNIRHQDSVRVLFPYFRNEFINCLAVAPLLCSAVKGNHIRPCGCQFIHLFHSRSNVAFKALIFNLNQADDRESGFFFDSNDIADTAGTYSRCSRLLCRPGHQIHDGFLFDIERLSGNCLAGNNDFAFQLFK